MKKKISLIWILLAIVIVIGIVFLIKPNQKTFSMELEVEQLEYNVDDTINIKVKLNNNSIGFYKAVFLNAEINVLVYLEGTTVYLPQLMLHSYFLPFLTFTKNIFTELNEPGRYIVKAYSSFTIRGQEFILEKIIPINNTLFIKAKNIYRYIIKNTLKGELSPPFRVFLLLI